MKARSEDDKSSTVSQEDARSQKSRSISSAQESISKAEESDIDSDSGNGDDKRRQCLQRTAKFFYDGQTGAILTRTPLSWAKVWALVILNWTLTITFTVICWYLFKVIMLDRHDVPYWTYVGANNRYTRIHVQPDLDIKKASEYCDLCFSVRPNRLVNWKPVPLSDQNKTEELALHLERNGGQLVDNHEILYITCEPQGDIDERGISYAKNRISSQDGPGIKLQYFPLPREKSPNEEVIFEITDPKFQTEEKGVTVSCLSWADNIDSSDDYVYRDMRPGGGKAEFSVKNGRIV